jgi:hypothetical protein
MTKFHVSIEFDSIEEAASFFDRSVPDRKGEGALGVIGAQATATVQSLPKTAEVAAPVAVQTPVVPSTAASVAQPSSTSVLPTTPTALSAAGAASASAAPATSPTSDTGDFAAAVRSAMAEMVARVDAKGTPGSGAVKVKEILGAHGLTRGRDATAAQAPLLIAAFNAVV